MAITKLQVLEAKLLLAKANREWYNNESSRDFMYEIEDSDKRLSCAEEKLSEYLIESAKTDLGRLQERLAVAEINLHTADVELDNAINAHGVAADSFEDLQHEVRLLKEELNDEI